MKIVYFLRKSFKNGNYSIEKVFRIINGNMSNNISTEIKVSSFHTSGFIKRLFNTFEAIFHQGEINHITGDIHYIAIFLKKRKTVLTIHDFSILRRSSGFRYFIYYVFWYYLPIVRVRFITVISNQIKQELLELFPFAEKKTIVVYNPITIPIYNQKKIGFNKSFPKILHIGVTENKNLERTIIALSKINCHLRIIGSLDIHHLSLLEKYKINFSNDFNLSDEELINEYLNADILSFLSTYEGFGLPIVEAQLLNVPVLTSNINVLKEVSGLDDHQLANPFDIDDIIFHLDKIINDDIYRDELVLRGIDNVKRFKVDEICKQYLSLYKTILN
jgi:glycosyltransferase involved in cell wall biosynthesis